MNLVEGNDNGKYGHYWFSALGRAQENSYSERNWTAALPMPAFGTLHYNPKNFPILHGIRHACNL